MATITSRFVKRARARGVTVHTRRQWATPTQRAIYAWRRVNRRHAQLPKRPTDTLVQHITVTRDDGPTQANFNADMRELHAIGASRFGSGVSYNLVWDMTTGEIGLGQALDAAGTHTLNDKNVPGYSENLNYYAIAIAAIGMPGKKPTARAVEALARTIAALIDVKALNPGHDYVPHSLFAFKDCPTDPVRAIMPEVNRRARELASSKAPK
jgi:hypothetical protein